MQILQDESCRDETTGLFNRTGFIEMADVEIERALRNDSPLTLIYMSLERFHILSYEEQDSFLLMFLANLVDLVRRADVVSRWKEDQFIMLLPNTAPEDASKILENIRTKLNAALSRYDSTVTVRIGGITYLTAPYDGEYLAHALDQLLKSPIREFQIAPAKRFDMVSVS
jgi:diguanylate cyclase (GGDEF)-like protein